MNSTVKPLESDVQITTTTGRGANLENILAFQIRAAGLPTPKREFRAINGRRFRWDFAWIEHRLLLEVQGGTFSSGKMGHNSGLGLHRDMEKANLATLAGWRVLAVAERHIKTGKALQWIQEALKPSIDEPKKGITI